MHKYIDETSFLSTDPRARLQREVILEHARVWL